jgi:hypothetical protein
LGPFPVRLKIVVELAEGFGDRLVAGADAASRACS